MQHCRFCGSRAASHSADVEGYRFFECEDCGFAFTPDVRDDQMARQYRHGYHGPAEGAPSRGWLDVSFLRPAFERLATAGRRLTVLDFGTGQSRLPNALRAVGHKVVAIDVVPPLRPHPDRLTGSLESLYLPAARFDLIYAYQVFEHLPEPRPVLDSLLRLARPGGLVLIHTDMETPERAAGLDEWWYVMPPDHCSFYRHRSFEAVLRNSPHRIVWRNEKSVLVEKRE